MIGMSGRALRRVMNRARIVLVLLVVTHLTAGVLFSLIEKKGFHDGQWWATVTGFTVGYGDLYPETAAGRLVGQFYIIFMALLWLILGAHIVASIIEDKNLFSHEEQERHEAALLALLKDRGLVTENFCELPHVEWFQANHGFVPEDD